MRSGSGDANERLVWLREEPSSRNPAHSREAIARVALELADREGLEAVSMRRVAQELGAGTMTLYHYVANKDELLMLMTDAAMGEVLVPDEELPEAWRPAIGRIAIQTREALSRHRWLLDRLGAGPPGPNSMRHFEQSLRAMAGAGLSERARFEVVVAVDEYVYGFAIHEAQERTEQERGWEPDVRQFIQREIDSGEFPLMRRLFGPDVDAGLDRVTEVFFEPGRFERGLDRLLDGIEAGLDR